MRELLPSLRHGEGPAVVIVQHAAPSAAPIAPEYFSEICGRVVREAESHEPVLPGEILFAPGGYHLMVSKNAVLELSVDEPVRFSRPSIDVFFETVAEAYGPRALGVILSGANDDGALGARALAEAGARVIVQDPAQAKYPQMPTAALAAAPQARALPLKKIAEILGGLT